MVYLSGFEIKSNVQQTIGNVLSWYKATRRSRTSVLKGVKNIPRKACLLRVRKKVEIVRGNISVHEKHATLYQYSFHKECQQGVFLYAWRFIDIFIAC